MVIQEAIEFMLQETKSSIRLGITRPTIYRCWELRIPKYYTEKENDIWRRWPYFPYGPGPLDVDLWKRGKMIVNICGIQVHALLFGEVAAGFEVNARWDCYNGWTHIPSEIIW